MDVEAPERDGCGIGIGSSNNVSPAPPADIKAGPATPAPASDNGGESSGEDAAPSPASAGKKNYASSSATSAKSNEGSDAADATAIKAALIANPKNSFPLHLTRMLESVETMRKEHIVHWGDDQKSFVIVDVDAFLSEVLPIFFKSRDNPKIRSFYRTLNRWGFRKGRKNANNPNANNPHDDVWSHPNFQRPTAVTALAEFLKNGWAIDFLNTAQLRKNRVVHKRRIASNPLYMDSCYPFGVRMKPQENELWQDIAKAAHKADPPTVWTMSSAAMRGVSRNTSNPLIVRLTQQANELRKEIPREEVAKTGRGYRSSDIKEDQEEELCQEQDSEGEEKHWLEV